jgi:Tfp pilus assembly protein PilO
MNRAAYYILGTLAVALAWYFLLFTPQQAQREKARQEYTQVQSEVNDFHSTIADFPAHLATRDKLESFRSDLEQRLFAKNDIMRLFEELNTVAGRHEVTVKELRPSVEQLLKLQREVADSGDPEFLNVGITATGAYADLGRYLRYIETADFFRGLEYCEINPAAGIRPTVMMHLEFRALLGSGGPA